VKPWPDDIDEWTHYLHGADGNPVAQDRVVGQPEHWQWVSEPMFMRSHETDSSISTMVTARGRLLFIEDQAPISLAGQHPLPDKWFLVARDAFNGVLLWKVPIRRWGWREWKSTWFSLRPGDIPLNLQKRLVAVGNRVYVTLGYQAPVSQLDARTGAILQTYAGTERTNEILFLDDTLYLSVLRDDGVRVMALDADTGEQRWMTDKLYGGSLVDYYRWRSMRGRVEAPKLDPTLNTATDGRVVAFIDGPHVVCLDAKTGAETWRSDFPEAEADHRAGGVAAKSNLWVGTMIVADGVVLHASPNKLAAFDAGTGKVLWEQPKRYIGHLWYEWKDVFVIDGLAWTWGADLVREPLEGGSRRHRSSLFPTTVKGYDLETGKVVKNVPLGKIFKTHHHHRCYRNKATSRYILASRRGTEYVDLEQGQHTVHNWVRGTCHMGMMPTNGLQYAPPHPCACYIDEKLNGMLALAPKREGRGTGDEGPAEKDNRLERGPAYSSPLDTRHLTLDTSLDWPTFRHDAMRTGSVETEIPREARRRWRVELGRRVSAPTAVGDQVFVALVDEHQVVCLDAKDGAQRWAFVAGGRVDSPPTWHKGRVLFGSADGSVYCLRASDGALAWRFRAAPGQWLMAAFGQLESAWPVHGSVLVVDDTVYFAAGRSSQLDGGLYVYGLDAATGKLRHQAHLEGPDYAVEGLEQNYGLPMGALPDVLISDGSHVFMRAETFDLELNRTKGRPELRTRSGLLEDSYFKRMPWTHPSGGYGRLLVQDKRSVYYVRMFDSLRGLDPSVYFTPGAKGYTLFARNLKGKSNAWMERVPVRIRAMVLAGGHLVVAGPPDVVDPEDPLGAFEGRKGGLLYVVDAESGERVAEHTLPFPPVFNGAAAARGRLYLAETDGAVSCFGK
ncbi:MAG: PQQ-binding-like beta-propeller repeat protein, partial [Planctomycetota bacterium]